MFVFRFQPVLVLLFVTLAAIHSSGSFHGLVILVYHTRMTSLTRYLTPVNRSLISPPGDMKPALRTPLLMASDTIFGCICKEVVPDKKNEEYKTVLN